MVVPFAPGGGTDVIARHLAARMSDSLKRQIAVDNRAGANGIVGTENVARAPADGYTLLFVSSPHSVNPALYPKLPYDTVRDFAPVSMAATSPYVLVVHASLPVRSIKELIALAKAQQGQIDYGSGGVGTPGHLAGEMLNTITGIKMLHIPYKGAGQALIDLLGAQIQMVCTSTLPALPHVRSGQLRALAVTTAARTRAAPDMPTVAEAASLPGYRASTWYALFAPARTPAAVINTLHRSATQALKSASVIEQLMGQGGDPIGNTPDDLRQFLQTEIDVWTKVIRQAGIKPNT